MLLMMNVAIMPLKAYISEPLPWTLYSVPEFTHDCRINYTLCTQILPSFFYNISKFMPPESSIVAPTFDLHAVTFPLIPSQVQDPIDYALHFPYAGFYCNEGIYEAIAVASGHKNISQFKFVGSVHFLGILTHINIMWAAENPSENVFYAGIAMMQMTIPWLTFKLFFRISLSIYIVRYMWKHYYRHYVHLSKALCFYGLDHATKNCKFEIIVGDPTSIILLDPVVSLLFIIDFWISEDFVGRVLNNILQLAVMKDFILAYLFLSRTVWFGYGSLNLTSYLLKKFHCDRYFHGVDPSWTAIGIALVAGPMTLLQSRMSFTIHFYNILFTSLANNDRETETVLASIFYTLILGVLPVVCGFMPRDWFHNSWVRVFNSAHARLKSMHSSYHYNDTKNRWTLHLVFFTFNQGELTTKGGAVYNLFIHDSKYKKNLGISQCGSDCYVKWMTGAEKWTCYRLSLLSCIDVQSPMQFTSTKQPTAVGSIELDGEVVRVIQGSNKSAWVL
ncbi:hypothetical protein THRCLA_22705 [Thraustotheca clavata]|uniref:Transmembrane protein n=1 Tax=Thraustotheca clavata TaxID=74557 RepID=A0A1V9YUW1_9STRA|nr:hypothetical protein THRCLA_22705 [Thraustotheca clavata]